MFGTVVELYLSTLSLSYFNPAKETENAFIKVREIVLIDYSLPFAIPYKILSVT